MKSRGLVMHQLANMTSIPEDALNCMYDDFMIKSENTGHLSHQDLVKALTNEPSLKSPVNLAEQLSMAFDHNSDGFVEVRGFCMGMAALIPSASPTNKLNFIFMMYDADGNGALDRDECAKLVRDMLQSSGNAKDTIDTVRVTQIVGEIFQHTDIDNSNSIDVQEFQQLATNPALANIGSDILNLLKHD